MKLGKCYRERCFLSCHEYETKKKILSPMRKNIFLFFFTELKTFHLSYSIWENVVHLKFSRNIIVFKGRDQSSIWKPDRKQQG